MSFADPVPNEIATNNTSGYHKHMDSWAMLALLAEGVVYPIGYRFSQQMFH